MSGYSMLTTLEAGTLTITPHECNMSGYSMLTALEASTLTSTHHECNMSEYSKLYIYQGWSDKTVNKI